MYSVENFPYFVKAKAPTVGLKFASVLAWLAHFTRPFSARKDAEMFFYILKYPPLMTA